MLLFGSAVLLQFAATNQFGILETKGNQPHSLFLFPPKNGFPGWRYRPNSGPFFLNSAVNQNGVNFANFKNSQKIKYKS